MTDLTKIDRPFGLLDGATQKALRECGGPWEYYSDYDGWQTVGTTLGFPCVLGTVYRQKPQPPTPRDFWVELDTAGRAVAVHEYGHGIIHPTAHQLVRVREVMPE